MHHSTCDDNPFLPQSYIDNLDELQYTDEDLYRIARMGEFGTVGSDVFWYYIIFTHSRMIRYGCL